MCFFAHGNEELRDGTVDDLAVINIAKLQMEQEVLEDPVLGASLLKIRAAVAEGNERAKKVLHSEPPVGFLEASYERYQFLKMRPPTLLLVLS